MNDLEMIPEKKDRITDFQDKYNTTSKNIIHRLSTNIALYICILLPIILIGFIWTDFGAPKIGFKLLSEGVITVALFVIGETMMMRIGANGGKLDLEYIQAKQQFNKILDKVNDKGTMLLAVFCEWQIDVELEQATTRRLRRLRITREEWEKVKDLPYSDLTRRYGYKRAKGIMELNRLEPVELNDALLLYDNTRDILVRGGVPMSGEGYLYKKIRSPEMILSCVFTGLLTLSVAVTLTADISFARVIYTIFKLIVLLYRMAVGYGMGANAYNTVEVRQLKARSNYLSQYVRFVEDKIYLRLGNKYGDVSCYVNEPIAEPKNTVVD